MTRFAKDQPKGGETVLHCGHLRVKPHHFFQLRNDQGQQVTVGFTRPDGTRAEAQWLVLCDSCFAADPDPTGQMRADATWIGDEPIIEDRTN